MVGQTKLNIDFTRKEVTSDYIFETLFRISEKSLKDNFKNHEIAKKLVIKAAQRGEQGWFAEDWAELIKEYNITESQYFSIIRTLKNAGILRKTKGKYYAIWEFPDHLSAMAATFNTFYAQHGKTRS